MVRVRGKPRRDQGDGLATFVGNGAIRDLSGKEGGGTGSLLDLKGGSSLETAKDPSCNQADEEKRRKIPSEKIGGAVLEKRHSTDPERRNPVS